MRVLVAGASGAVGQQLLPQLVRRGHQVAGIVRSEQSRSRVAARGAEPLVVDALDVDTLTIQTCRFRPDAVVHQLTALPKEADLRDFDKVFARTNELRTFGTDNLIAAARAAGVKRFVAQGFCGWPYARSGGLVKTEDDPFDPTPAPALRRTLGALIHLENAVLRAADLHGIILRYGAFYGPGTAISADGSIVEALRRRRFPLVGRAEGVWSFVHVADIATATAAAIEGDSTGVFNVVDDDPAPVSEWLPALARAAGAKPPMRLPAWLARLILPRHLYGMMTDVRGGANLRFKAAFQWRPRYPSWRSGFNELFRPDAGRDDGPGVSLA